MLFVDLKFHFLYLFDSKDKDIDLIFPVKKKMHSIPYVISQIKTKEIARPHEMFQEVF